MGCDPVIAYKEIIPSDDWHIPFVQCCRALPWWAVHRHFSSAKHTLLCVGKDAHFTSLRLYFLTRSRQVPVPSHQRSARENVITSPSSSPIQAG